MYRYEAKSVEGFVQQIAVSLVLHKYFFYVTGTIPERKDPHAVDAKLIDRYGLDISKFVRCRRKREGIAGVQYLRHGHFFALLATHGKHSFFELEGKVVSDIREHPIQCFGYSIGCYERKKGEWHPSVRISREVYRSIKDEMGVLAIQMSKMELAEKIRALPFAPFAPVRTQFCGLLKYVNQCRKKAGLSPVSSACVRRRRKPVVVFESIR